MSTKKDLITSYWTKKSEKRDESVSNYWSKAPNASVPSRKA